MKNVTKIILAAAVVLLFAGAFAGSAAAAEVLPASTSTVVSALGSLAGDSAVFEGFHFSSDPGVVNIVIKDSADVGASGSVSKKYPGLLVAKKYPGLLVAKKYPGLLVA